MENREICPLHNGMKEDVDGLFDKMSKLNDKLFWIMLLLAMNLFFSGINVAGEIFMNVLRLPH